MRILMEMGIFCVYPKPDLSKPCKWHKKYPYLLRNMNIWLPNQVWAIDITYISLGHTAGRLTEPPEFEYHSLRYAPFLIFEFVSNIQHYAYIQFH